jgi:hypothetical protein
MRCLLLTTMFLTVYAHPGPSAPPPTSRPSTVPSVIGPASQPTAQPAHTPEAALDSVLRAMKAGDKDSLRWNTTDKGYKALVSNKDGTEVSPEHLQATARQWEG